MIKIMIIMMVMILTIIFAFNHGDDVTYEVADPCVPRARVAHQSPCCQCVNLQIMVIVILLIISMIFANLNIMLAIIIIILASSPLRTL